MRIFAKISNLLLFLPILCLPLIGFSQIEGKKGDSITDRLVDGEIAYEIALDSGRYIAGFVEQEAVDVRIDIIDPKGETLHSFDALNRGRESFYFDTHSSGIYSVKILGDDGSFQLQIQFNEPIASDPQKRVRQWLQPFNHEGSPGVGVAVFKDSKTQIETYAGMANLSYQIPMGSNTRHNIGSTSKHFTAFGLMLLVEKGVISLTDDVRKYIPELPEFSDTVQVHNLLNHTSGYREFINTVLMMGQHPSTPLDRKKIIEMIQHQPALQNVPGSEFNYNNTAFSLVAEIIERVSEEPFERYMERAVFLPLEMEHTQYRSNNQQIIPNRSVGYAPAEDNAYQEVTDLGGGMGPGGLYTTLSDFKKWMNHFHDPTLCRPETLKKMMTSDTLPSGKPTTYGYGLFIQEYKGQRYIHHGGADLAHRSHMMYFPEINGAVVVQSNAANFPADLPLRIADLYFDDHFTEEAEERDSTEAEPKDSISNYEYELEEFERLCGRYELRISPGFILRFFIEDDKMMAQATGQPALELEALSDSTFNIVPVPNASLTFHIEEDGSSDSLTLHQGGHLKAIRIQWTPDANTLAEYEGTYYSPELETTIQLRHDGDTLELHHYRFPSPFYLEAGQKDRFGSTTHFGAFGEVAFHRNEKEEIDGLHASNGRTKGIWFQRIPSRIIKPDPALHSTE